MGAVKCPVCSAINQQEELQDGEMIKCSHCKKKFTVTRLRRFGRLSEELEKCSVNLHDDKLLEEFVVRLDDERLTILIELVTGELVKRYRKKDGLLQVGL
ncbi:MAG: hypothetical protein WAO24_05860 [Peptococcia bacterium]